MSNVHDHDHGGHGHDHHDHGAHDHSDEIEPALQSLLYKQIEFQKIVALNESTPDSGSKVIQKTWAQRLDTEPVLTSDADEQLLVTVPFAGTVKLHSILIRSSTDASAPRTLKLFLNKEGLDFSAVSDLKPAQVLTLSQTSDVQDVPVKRTLFGNTYSLTLFFEDNFGDDKTSVYYLAFKGEYMKLNREPVEFLYEKAANPRDHAPIVGAGDMASSGPNQGI
ncbi:hypothetical protein MMC25_002035 [Agyrium rufum]|nr:hypothetical protein [Agyrium rufum]